MKRWPVWLGTAALAVAASTLGVGSASAQPPGERYPYWDSAPTTYPQPGANLPTPPPPGAPRDAFRPSPWAYYGGIGPGAFGGVPPYAYLNDGRRFAGRPVPSDNRARIWLTVPADAQVWFDGEPTQQTGELRHFVSPPLAPGRSYTYGVRVRWMKDGKPVEEERRVRVQAGAPVWSDFTQAAGVNDAGASRAFGMMRFAVPK
jgi:uncharacterized protein (TIGR03000 family)